MRDQDQNPLWREAVAAHHMTPEQIAAATAAMQAHGGAPPLPAAVRRRIADRAISRSGRASVPPRRRSHRLWTMAAAMAVLSTSLMLGAWFHDGSLWPEFNLARYKEETGYAQALLDVHGENKTYAVGAWGNIDTLLRELADAMDRALPGSEFGVAAGELRCRLLADLAMAPLPPALPPADDQPGFEDLLAAIADPARSDHERAAALRRISPLARAGVIAVQFVAASRPDQMALTRVVGKLGRRFAAVEATTRYRALLRPPAERSP
ncbi:MAG: hypothetical protein K8J09_10745 [Planctomycetes bacterium]|nr:hypothetical protein [Planctomycetota bacterium]MCC7398617.1 hypothetical protein [Planctomycetota bacterium]